MAIRHNVTITKLIDVIEHNNMLIYNEIVGLLIAGGDIVITLQNDLPIADVFTLITGVRKILYDLLFNDDYFIFDRKVGKIIFNYNGKEIYF